MNRTATTGSALGAVLFLSLWMRTLVPGAGVPPSLAGSAKQTAMLPSPTGSQENDGPWKASQEFFAGPQSECGGAAGAGNPRKGKWCIPPGVSVRALIAILPDPVRTHMALTFDRTLEGIQLAAQDKEFVIDRYWLPWSAPALSTSPASDQAPQAIEQRRTEPGVVLFRRNADQKTADPLVLFVFLVADTPTAGIDGRQFTKAVSYIDEVLCSPKGDSTAPSSDCPIETPVRVVGPSFSGSLASLRRLTDADIWRNFVVYSGSVSSVCAMAEQGLLDKWPDELSDVCGQEPKDYGSAVSIPTVAFRTFAHDTESAIRSFVRIAYPHPDRDCTRPQIAILSETATTFGASVRGPSNPNCITNLAFPREIASLRNASRSAATPALASPQGPGGKTPFLPLDLNDRTNSSDAPPEYSSAQGPLSKEAVLMNLAAGLRRAHYRYIGIVGSNVLDILFLADFLRAACPDSRLFTMRGDLLFERQFDNAPYIGMIALTTYPLIDRELNPAEFSWREARLHLPFADEYEQAEYQATLQTIKEMVPENPALSSQPSAMENTPAADAISTSARPLWMMVVGDGGYWPVRLLEGAPPGTPKLALSPTDFTGSWQLLLVLVSMAAALQITVLLVASPFAPRFRDFALVTAAPVQRIFFIQIACGSLACGLVLLLMPAWRYGEPTSWLERAGTAALAAVVAVAIVVEATAYLRYRWKQRIDPGAPDATGKTLKVQLLLFSLVWIATGGAAYEWWRLLGADPASLRGFFFAYRAVHPLSGVSPITPMIPLLAAIYLWALFEIWRLRFNETMRPRLFPQQADNNATTGIQTVHGGRPHPGLATERSIAEAIKRYFLKGEYVALFIAAFGVWLFSFHPSRPFVLFEANGFAVLYSVLFGLVVALMLSSGLRMTQIWTTLRGLLNELERSRVRGTFARLNDRGWSFWRQGGEDAEWTQMARALEVVDGFGGGTPFGSPESPGERFVVERMRSLKGKAETLDRALERNESEPDRDKTIDGLRTGIETIQKVLVGTDGSTFVRTAVEDAHRSVDACVSLVGVGDCAILRSALQTFCRKLDAALVAVELVRASSSVQDKLRTVREMIGQFRGGKRRFTMMGALLEYARTPKRSKLDGGSQVAPASDKVKQANTTEAAIESLQESLAVGLKCALAVLQGRWSAGAPEPDDGEEAGRNEKKTKSTPEAGQLACLEEYAALRYVAFIRSALGHLRHVMAFVAISFSLVLISLNIYSFEPHRSLIWSFIAIFFVTGFMIVGALMQLHRDPIMSRISGTTAHSLDLHFYLRIAAFGAVPLLTLIATTFPSLGRYLASFIGPSLEALK
jgi:hypothetical protein